MSYFHLWNTIANALHKIPHECIDEYHRSHEAEIRFGKPDSFSFDPALKEKDWFSVLKKYLPKSGKIEEQMIIDTLHHANNRNTKIIARRERRSLVDEVIEKEPPTDLSGTYTVINKYKRVSATQNNVRFTYSTEAHMNPNTRLSRCYLVRAKQRYSIPFNDYFRFDFTICSHYTPEYEFMHKEYQMEIEMIKFTKDHQEWIKVIKEIHDHLFDTNTFLLYQKPRYENLLVHRNFHFVNDNTYSIHARMGPRRKLVFLEKEVLLQVPNTLQTTKFKNVSGITNLVLDGEYVEKKDNTPEFHVIDVIIEPTKTEYGFRHTYSDLHAQRMKSIDTLVPQINIPEIKVIAKTKYDSSNIDTLWDNQTIVFTPEIPSNPHLILNKDPYLIVFSRYDPEENVTTFEYKSGSGHPKKLFYSNSKQYARNLISNGLAVAVNANQSGVFLGSVGKLLPENRVCVIKPDFENNSWKIMGYSTEPMFYYKEVVNTLDLIFNNFELSDFTQ